MTAANPCPVNAHNQRNPNLPPSAIQVLALKAPALKAPARKPSACEICACEICACEAKVLPAKRAKGKAKLPRRALTLATLARLALAKTDTIQAVPATSKGGHLPTRDSSGFRLRYLSPIRLDRHVHVVIRAARICGVPIELCGEVQNESYFSNACLPLMRPEDTIQSLPAITAGLDPQVVDILSMKAGIVIRGLDSIFHTGVCHEVELAHRLRGILDWIMCCESSQPPSLLKEVGSRPISPR